jgi:protein-tyrosine-phosphatase
VEITSAGTHAADGSPASDSALEVTRKQGIDITRHRSRKLGKQMIENSDLVLVMERSHMNAVRQLCPGRGEHVMLLGELGGAARADRSSEGREILDPVAGSVATYEMCFARIEESLTKGLGFLSGLISSRGISSEREE